MASLKALWAVMETMIMELPILVRPAAYC
jgi:hypothetical protein